jgi:uncharacterized protein (TIGR02246 family)
MRSSPLGAALAVLLAGAIVPAAAWAQTTFRVDSRSVGSVDGELAALRAEYAAAANAGDAARLAALYAADAIAVPREGLMLRGPDAIVRYSREALSTASPGATITLTPRHFEAYGSIASETGTFFESRMGEEQPVATGAYVAIYTRGADGAWRIALEVRTHGRDKPVVGW